MVWKEPCEIQKQPTHLGWRNSTQASRLQSSFTGKDSELSQTQQSAFGAKASCESRAGKGTCEHIWGSQVSTLGFPVQERNGCSGGSLAEDWEPLECGLGQIIIRNGCALSPLIYRDVRRTLLLKNSKQPRKTKLNQNRNKNLTFNTPTINPTGKKTHTKIPPKENRLCTPPQTCLNPQSQ